MEREFADEAWQTSAILGWYGDRPMGDKLAHQSTFGAQTTSVPWDRIRVLYSPSPIGRRNKKKSTTSSPLIWGVGMRETFMGTSDHLHYSHYLKVDLKR